MTILMEDVRRRVDRHDLGTVTIAPPDAVYEGDNWMHVQSWIAPAVSSIPSMTIEAIDY
jgi:hypothetical protein